MNGFDSKVAAWSAIIVGSAGILAVVALILFFVHLFQNIPSLSSMGRINDTLNAEGLSDTEKKKRTLTNP